MDQLRLKAVPKLGLIRNLVMLLWLLHAVGDYTIRAVDLMFVCIEDYDVLPIALVPMAMATMAQPPQTSMAPPPGAMSLTSNSQNK